MSFEKWIEKEGEIVGGGDCVIVVVVGWVIDVATLSGLGGKRKFVPRKWLAFSPSAHTHTQKHTGKQNGMKSAFHM